MLPRWQTVAERWPISTSQIGASRLLMQSSQLAWWSLAHVQVHVVLGERLLDDLGRGRLDRPAGDVDRPLLALEGAAAPGLLPLPCSQMIFTPSRRCRRSGSTSGVSYQPSLWNWAGRLDGDRARLVHAEAPLGDVEVVGAEVGHLAAGVVPEEAEEVVDALRVVRPLGAGPSQSRSRARRGGGVGDGGPGRSSRRGGRRGPSGACRSGRCGPARRPGGTGRRSAAGCRSARSGSCLRAAATIAWPSAMVRRQRLLAVHVLARLAGVDRDQRVPVVGRGDDDRVDVLVVEQLAVVGVGLAGPAAPSRPSPWRSRARPCPRRRRRRCASSGGRGSASPGS